MIGIKVVSINGMPAFPRSIDDINEQKVKKLRLKYLMPNIQQDSGQYFFNFTPGQLKKLNMNSS